MLGGELGSNLWFLVYTKMRYLTVGTGIIENLARGAAFSSKVR